MINVTIDVKLNNSSNLNVMIQEISELLQQISGNSVNTKVNMKDNDQDMSPIGLYKTNEYLRLRDKI